MKINKGEMMKLPKDNNGVQVKIGDKVRGFGYIKFQDGWRISLDNTVTVNIQDGHLYFGNLSYESYKLSGFVIVNKNGDNNGKEKGK
jgi:hypothetical protein